MADQKTYPYKMEWLEAALKNHFQETRGMNNNLDWETLKVRSVYLSGWQPVLSPGSDEVLQAQGLCAEISIVNGFGLEQTMEAHGSLYQTDTQPTVVFHKCKMALGHHWYSR